MSAILSVGAVGFLCAAVLIHLALRFQWCGFLLKRRVDWHHANKAPVARIGGAVLVLSAIIVELYIAVRHPEVRQVTPFRNVCWFVLLAVFCLGFFDDVQPLDWRIRLAGQGILAGLVCGCGLGFDLHRVAFLSHTPALFVLGPLLTFVWLVGLPFSINNLDGMDGLAGTVSLLSTIVVAMVAHHGGYFELLASGIAGGLLAFLCFNLPPARVYLGDSGAYFLGLQLALFSLVNARNGSNPVAIVAPLFVLALPLADVALTLARRYLHGLPLARPDRLHLHHRLLAIFDSPARVVCGYFALNLLFFGMSLAVVWTEGRWAGRLGIGLIVILTACAAAFPFSRRWFLVHRVIRRAARLRRETGPARRLIRHFKTQIESSSGPQVAWPFFVATVEAIGFQSIAIRELQGPKAWTQTRGQQSGPTRQYQPANAPAALEVGVLPCPLGASGQTVSCAATGQCRLGRARCLSNPHAFEVVSDLVAEAWHFAGRRWPEPARCAPIEKSAVCDVGKCGSPAEVGYISAQRENVQLTVSNNA